jgi:hypothetical protein
MPRKIIEFTELQTPDGTTFYLDTNSKFMLTEEGLGMPEIDYISQQGPYQHGETIYDYRLKPRILQYLFRQTDCSRDNYWNNRNTLLDMLRPNRQSPGEFALATLIKTLSNGNRRAIDVTIQQGPIFKARNMKQWDEYSIMETLRFIAADPTFYDPTQVSESWTLTPDTQDRLEFPFTFDGTDMQFRQAVTDADHVITYTGTWSAYPTITIVGPLYYPRITHSEIGDVIYLDYEIADSETVTISLEFSNKTVESDTHGNIIGTVRDISDLATFHIAPDPEVTGGVNTINVIGNNATGDTTITMTYYTRYIGI